MTAIDYITVLMQPSYNKKIVLIKIYPYDKKVPVWNILL